MKEEPVGKVIQVVCVLAGFATAFLVYNGINPEKLIKPDNTPITISEIHANPQKNYVGRTAGKDINVISKAEEFMALNGTEYVTAQPQSVVTTGIYSLNPWVDPYEITKVRNSSGRMVSSGRRASEVTDNMVEAVEYYQEYYLIQLTDGSYILAQFSDTYREKIQEEDTVLLPIGRRKTNSSTARQYLEEICRQYDVDNTYTLYMIDDEWQQDHEFTFMMIKYGIAVVVFFVVAVGLLLMYDKMKQ